ncbi:MAG: hypothetical protein VYA84_20525, partial [Planctomycetota bacterium]|nr:hypothetical protein [Planctomycetota bacterium]
MTSSQISRNQHASGNTRLIAARARNASNSRIRRLGSNAGSLARLDHHRGVRFLGQVGRSRSVEAASGTKNGLRSQSDWNLLDLGRLHKFTKTFHDQLSLQLRTQSPSATAMTNDVLGACYEEPTARLKGKSSMA